jgi:uncharacterized protein
MIKTALITGASGGIGKELAKIFARNGNNLVLVARNSNELKQLASELGQKHNISAKWMAHDLSQPNKPQEIYDQLKKQGIQIDYLINNAGFGHFGYFTKTDWAKEEQLINLNMLALTHMTKLFVKDMITRGYGKIMNVSSTAAFQPGPLMAVYYASKAYVQSFSEALANETKGTGVSVTALCPGPTKSGFEKAAALEESKLFKQLKLASAQDVAEYGFKKMMNGQTVAIHGTLNKIMIAVVKVLPKKIVIHLVRKLSEKK